MEQSLSVVGRRSFCKYLAGGTAAAAGISSMDTAAALHDEYGTVINVANEGAARDASESVSSLVQGLIEDDTLIRFPEGRYLMDEEVRLTNFRNVGVQGKGDATIVPADYWAYEGPEYRLFRFGTGQAPGNGLRFQDLTVDQRANNTGIRTIDAQVEDDLLVTDIDVVGRHDTGTWGPGLFTITDPNGSGVVRRFRAPDGGEPSENTPGDLWMGPTGILCNGPHRGKITFENCVLVGFPDNGLYGAGGEGEIVVQGGYYANSGTASIRLGGRRGSIRDATVVVDSQPFDIGQEGIRLQYGYWFELENLSIEITNPNGEGLRVQDEVGGMRISDSDLRMDAPAYTLFLIEDHAGEAYVRDVDLEINGSANAIQIRGEDAGQVGLSNVLVTGSASGERMRHAIRCLRDDVELRDVNVAQNGGSQRRGLCLKGDNAFVYHCYMTTSHRPMSVFGNDIWINDCGLTTDGWPESIRLHEGAHDIRLKSNWLPEGIVDMGATGVVETGTSG